MPPGAPHHSFLRPYRIRVDDFSTPRNACFETPALQLLSHTHSDHITGLNAKSFGTRVVCSVDAKHMLLNGEPAATRIAFDKGESRVKTRPYAHLKIDPVLSASGKWERTHSRDLLHALPLNTPVPIEISDGAEVTITLIDANHCPGSVMFLVEGSQGNFLHTGDVRAEPAFLASLARNPWLQRYIPPSISYFDPAPPLGERPLKTLDAIYLDTACLLSYNEPPSKEEACAGIVRLISLFPPLTFFFINAWTWGYEDILKAVGRAFNSQIHVDRYKHDIYSGLSDPSLKSVITRNAESTRFHACERFDRCHQVEHRSTSVVYVNPVGMSKVQWDLYLNATHTSLKHGEHITNLLCPLSRHSTLPELRALVKLFKPKLVVPNSLDPKLGNLDWACMPRMFGDCMAEGGAEAIMADIRSANVDVGALGLDSALVIDGAGREDAEMQNLIGEGAEELVRVWTDSRQTDAEDGGATLEAASTRAQRTWMKLKPFLGGNGPKQMAKQRDVYASGQGANNEDSDCDDAAEARGRAAETFFAPTSPLSSPGRPRALQNGSPSVMPSEPRQSIPRRRTTLQKARHGSRMHFTMSQMSAVSSSPPQISSLSITSLSSPLRMSSGPSKERAFHFLFDGLQFETRPSQIDDTMSPGSRKEFQHPHVTGMNARLSTSLLESPCISVPPSPQKGPLNISRLPLASQSVTPWPARQPWTLSSSAAPPRTPVSDRTNNPQKTLLHESTRPPTLDLVKILKRTSTAAGLDSPGMKRKRSSRTSLTNTSSIIPPLSLHPVGSRQILPTCTPRSPPEQRSCPPHQHHPSTATGDDPSTPSRTILSHIEHARLPQAASGVATSSSFAQSPHSDAEKQRRRKAKEKQIQITMRLIRALPPDKIAPACRAKVEMREKDLAQRRAKHKPTSISASDRMNARCDAPFSSSPPRPNQAAAADSVQTQGTVADDQSVVDWDRVREIEQEIKEQRRKGLRYPQLPIAAKSFAQSQSP